MRRRQFLSGIAMALSSGCTALGYGKEVSTDSQVFKKVNVKSTENYLFVRASLGYSISSKDGYAVSRIQVIAPNGDIRIDNAPVVIESADGEVYGIEIYLEPSVPKGEWTILGVGPNGKVLSRVIFEYNGPEQ